MTSDNQGFQKYASESNRRKANKHLVKIVMAALNGMPYDIKKDINRVKYEYVLGQAIRQYLIPEINWHISVKAEMLWNEIAYGQDIRRFTYDEQFKATSTKKGIATFNGADRDSEKITSIDITAGNKYKFNHVFVCEHTTPVADIIDLLLEIGKPCEADVVNILDKIHITRMLRTEDRLHINVSSGRIKNSLKEIMKMTSQELFELLYERYYDGIEISTTNLTRQNDNTVLILDFKEEFKGFDQCESTHVENDSKTGHVSIQSNIELSKPKQQEIVSFVNNANLIRQMLHYKNVRIMEDSELPLDVNPSTLTIRIGSATNTIYLGLPYDSLLFKTPWN